MNSWLQFVKCRGINYLIHPNGDEVTQESEIAQVLCSLWFQCQEAGNEEEEEEDEEEEEEEEDEEEEEEEEEDPQTKKINHAIVGNNLSLLFGIVFAKKASKKMICDYIRKNMQTSLSKMILLTTDTKLILHDERIVIYDFDLPWFDIHVPQVTKNDKSGISDQHPPCFIEGDPSNFYIGGNIGECLTFEMIDGKMDTRLVISV